MYLLFKPTHMVLQLIFLLILKKNAFFPRKARPLIGFNSDNTETNMLKQPKVLYGPILKPEPGERGQEMEDSHQW